MNTWIAGRRVVSTQREEGPEAGVEGPATSGPTGIQLEGVWKERNHRRSHECIDKQLLSWRLLSRGKKALTGTMLASNHPISFLCTF